MSKRNYRAYALSFATILTLLVSYQNWWRIAIMLPLSHGKQKWIAQRLPESVKSDPAKIIWIVERSQSEDFPNELYIQFFYENRRGLKLRNLSKLIESIHNFDSSSKYYLSEALERVDLENLSEVEEFFSLYRRSSVDYRGSKALARFLTRHPEAIVQMIYLAKLETKAVTIKERDYANFVHDSLYTLREPQKIREARKKLLAAFKREGVEYSEQKMAIDRLVQNYAFRLKKLGEANDGE